VDPIGTAGCYGGYLLVELPLPWPGDVETLFAPDPTIRLQVVVPEAGDPRRFLYRRPTGDWFNGFEGPAREVLICSHGKRDVCCGSMGTVLAAQVSDRLPGVRVWRTSHTGGHRFAPTAIVLPEGTVWGYLDAESLKRIVTRDGPVPLEMYRGCSGLSSPAAQALERVALADMGWALFDTPRRTVALTDGRLRLETDGLGTWEGAVTERRRLPIPTCGQHIDVASKSQAELTVTAVIRSAGGPVTLGSEATQ
jgi:hypothetical protein